MFRDELTIDGRRYRIEREGRWGEVTIHIWIHPQSGNCPAHWRIVNPVLSRVRWHEVHTEWLWRTGGEV